jgi:hypothetical protein
MLAIFPYPFIAPAPTRAGAVIDSTVDKPTALIAPSTSRREALAALNDASLDRRISVSFLSRGSHHPLHDRLCTGRRVLAVHSNVGRR